MTAMTEEWVSFWYQCLSQNMDYSAYCNAKTAGDTAQCKSFEAQFERIADIYQDFGELDGWSEDGMQSKQWKEWFEPRRHLFMASATVITDPSAHVPRAGHLLLDVPLQNDANSTAKLVSRLMADYYAQHSVTVPTPPKYSLHLINGRPAYGYQQVRQACTAVARTYSYEPETSDALHHLDALTEFLRHEIDNMGWTLDPKARKLLMEKSWISEDRLESFKTRFNRCRKDFRAFARNTIRGRFPDDSPFDSDVLDIYTDEVGTKRRPKLFLD